jgi:FMNH2-dependent dimethyl sulfone monooxygenase
MPTRIESRLENAAPSSREDLDAYRREHVPLYNDQKLKLGVFNFNCSGGMVMVEDSPLRIEWDEMVRIAQLADRIGFEAIVPIGRWRGFGGSTNFNGRNFEPFTWAAALSAVTTNAMVFATAHVPLIHPLVAAKMAATIDHVSGGRFGLNLVMGWFTQEMRMFGIEQYEHDKRYRYGSEWAQIAKRVWTEPEPFDFRGDFFDLDAVEGEPKPVQPRPVLFNAGNSPAGLDFSAREVDFNLASVGAMETAREMTTSIRAKARDEYGREVGVLTYATVVCRDTEAEAKAAYEDILARGDWEGAQAVMDTLGIESQSFGEIIRDFQARFICGFGGHLIIGSHEQVVDNLKELSDSGFDGVLFGFVDFVPELEHFAANVMPLLKQAGLRH